MKVTQEHYGLIKERIDQAIIVIGIDMVKEHRAKKLGDDIELRFRWDLYHAANCQGIEELRQYSDAHIDTAIKQYIKSREDLSWL
jgi:hypothetical protein